MTDIDAHSREALLTVVAMAQAELEAKFDANGGCEPDAVRATLRDQLENLLWALNEAGLQNLYLLADAVATRLGDDEQAFDAASATVYRGWLEHLSLVLEMPDDPGLLPLLYEPLDPEVRAGLESLFDEAPQTAELAADHDAQSGIAVQDAFPGTFPDEHAASDTTQDSGLDDLPELDTESLLGMLAAEIVEVTPELSRHALTIAENAPGEVYSRAVKDYLDIVARIAAVATEIELAGLDYLCEFLRRNLTQLERVSGEQRLLACELLQGWPRVVIGHLARPDDDALCLEVVNYLEREGWPEPVPYRDQRELIEGLAKAAEISGDLSVEAREIEATDEDVSLEMSGDASPDLVEAFFAETPGHAESFSRLVAAIGEGNAVPETLEAAQRIAHTLKGSGNLVGVRGIANLSHHMEDIFDFIARHQMAPPVELAYTLQEAADTLETMVEYLQGLSPPPEDSRRVLQDVLDWANRIDSGQMRAADYAEVENRGKGRRAGDIDTLEQSRTARPDPGHAIMPDTVRVPVKLLDEIFRIVSETAITTGQIQERLNRLEGDEKLIRKNDSAMQQQRYELENLVSIRGMAARHRGVGDDAEGGDFDPLEMDEYDEFYGATHSFIESVADSREILRGFSSEVYELNALFVEQQRQNKELQQMVMTTRMVPVANLASRLQRTLRQVCRATDKQAELVIHGQDLLLDGDVLAKLADPLMHMLRNAVDHGIEDGGIRLDKGKPVAGRIQLDFRQEGNNVVVHCTDDGGGLDFSRIREVAIERGLIADQEIVDHASLARLILHSGFSTSDSITHVSGRGVGMDVVHNTIQSLNGSMDIEPNSEGEGTRVTLRLPITLLTSHCLLAGVGEEGLYAIPTVSLTQILAPGTGTLGRVGEKMTFQLEQDVYTACTLNSLIGVADSDHEDGLQKSSVLLVQTADGVSAVTVERVVTSYDLVVKNMGAYVKSISGIAGVSMLGNGEVVPVLDLAALLQTRDMTRQRFDQTIADSGESTAVRLPGILIVDDSLSVRNSLAQLMQDSGYRPILARDGMEAINLFESEAPDVVLTDLEMPRMNGLELASYIRTSSQRRETPVVMITSRNMAKHRAEAEKTGVNRFIAKPFTDDEVLDAIDAFLAVTA